MVKTYSNSTVAHLICMALKNEAFDCQWIEEPPSLTSHAIEPLPVGAPIKKVTIDPRALTSPKKHANEGFIANSDSKGHGIGIYLKKGTVCTLSDARDVLSCKAPSKK